MPSIDSQGSSLLPRVQFRLPGLDWLTALVVLMVLIHVLLERAGGWAMVPAYYMNFGLSWGGFSGGKVWQLLSYALVHGSWFHLLINVLMLWLVGGRVIHILGHRKCLQIVVAGILLGGVFHLVTGLVMMRAGHAESQLVGISGACLALLLTLTTLSPDSKMWPVPVSGKNLGLGLIFAELLLWLINPAMGIPVLSDLGQLMVIGGGGEMFRISHGCHLGGALAGWWLARRMLAPTLTLEKLQQMRLDREGEVEVRDAGDLG